MTYYVTDLGNCRPLKTGETSRHRTVEDAKTAAEIFADRYARRIYGKRGICRHVRLNLHNEAGTWQHYEAFIGVPVYGGGVTGKNVHFDVRVLS